MNESSQRARPAVELSDPKSIRALAHPARMAVIDELYSGRELTATECAEIAGLSPSAMSYHLRSLERAGIVEHADSTGDGRERPWRAAGSTLKIETADSSVATSTAAAALTATVLTRLNQQLGEWLANRDQEDPEWVEKFGANYTQLWLLPDEAAALQSQFFELTQAYRVRTDPTVRPEGARRVRAGLFVFPVDKRPS